MAHLKKRGKGRKSIDARKRRKARFLKELKECGTIDGAAAKCNIGRRTIYNWKAEDEEFTGAVEEAIARAYGDLRASMMSRAKKRSDVLAIFLAKGRWPEEFREKFQIDIQNDPGVRRLIEAVLQVIKEYVPREKLKDAAARFASLTNYQGPIKSNSAPGSGAVGSLPGPKDG